MQEDAVEFWTWEEREGWCYRSRTFCRGPGSSNYALGFNRPTRESAIAAARKEIKKWRRSRKTKHIPAPHEYGKYLEVINAVE